MGAPEQLQAELELVGGAGVAPEELLAQKQSRLNDEWLQYDKFIKDKAELDSWYNLRKWELEKEAGANTRAAAKITHQGWKDGASAIVNTLEALSTVQGKKSRTMFETLKVARIAQATISTYAAANDAMAETPGPSWVKIASAAAIITSGLANVASIASTSFSGGGGGGGASAAASGEYKYYSYEQSGYAGTGWKPGDREGGFNWYASSKPKADAGGQSTVVQKITINAMDAKSVKQLVDDNPKIFVAPIIQDIKDSGETKEVIRNYVQ